MDFDTIEWLRDETGAVATIRVPMALASGASRRSIRSDSRDVFMPYNLDIKASRIAPNSDRAYSVDRVSTNVARTVANDPTYGRSAPVVSTNLVINLPQSHDLYNTTATDTVDLVVIGQLALTLQYLRGQSFSESELDTFTTLMAGVGSQLANLVAGAR